MILTANFKYSHSCFIDSLNQWKDWFHCSLYQFIEAHRPVYSLLMPCVDVFFFNFLLEELLSSLKWALFNWFLDYNRNICMSQALASAHLGYSRRTCLKLRFLAKGKLKILLVSSVLRNSTIINLCNWLTACKCATTILSPNVGMLRKK